MEAEQEIEEQEEEEEEEEEEEVECDDDEELIDGECEPIECDPDEQLVGDSCEPIECDPDEQLVGNSCEPIECDPDEQLVGDSCEPIECDPDEQLVGNSCEPIECDPDEQLVGNSCEPIECDPDEQLVGNSCALSIVKDTSLELFTISDVNAEGLITLKGKLSTSGDSANLQGKPITFSGTGVTEDLNGKDVKTGEDGSFSVTGKASEEVGELDVKAHFAGDDENNATDSNIEKYTIAQPKATTYLTLDPISGVDAEGMITLTGVLEKDGSEDRVGIPDKPITFSGTGVTEDLNGKDVNTGADGRFTVEGEASDEVGELDVKAHFAGDDENNATDSNIENYTIAQPKATTYLTLDPISGVDAEGMITLTGVLEKDGSEDRVGIPDKPITFSGTGVTDDLNGKDVNTGADGRFTVEGEASDEVGELDVKAHFAGDDENNATDSNIENYTIAQPKATTYLTLDPISGVDAEGMITLTGVLEKDGSEDRVGIPDKPITFSGTGVTEDLNGKDVNTGADGRFTVEGEASDEVGELDVKAHFAGDDENNATDSNIENYTIAQPKATTYLTLDPISGVDAEGMITLTGVLEKDGQDVEIPGRVGIPDKPITFSGTGVTEDLNGKDVNTGADGRFTVEGEASDEVGELDVKAHFAGDDENNASNSNPEKYTTQQVIATTYLTLDPISGVDAEGMITLTGVLEKDGSEDRVGIPDKPITFSGTGVTEDLNGKDVNTGADGRFTVEGEASDEVGELDVKAHFAGDDENNASNSNPEKYTTQQVIATTYLKLDPIPDVEVTGNITVGGVLGVLTNGHQGEGIKDKNITFNTTGAKNLGTVITHDNGKFSVKGTASDIDGGWVIEAYFAGDANYTSSSDAVKYRTIPVRLDAQAITVQQFANEDLFKRYNDRSYGIPLHIPVLKPGVCDNGVFKYKYNDNKEEISKQDRDTLNYKPRDKGIPKTIEYTIRYDCTGEESEILKLFQGLYKVPIKPPLGVQPVD